MPATVTHAYFAMDIYEQLPIGLKKLLLDKKARLRMFAQSMDAMYFYHIFLPYKGSRQRQFGYYFHRHDSQTFFINLVNYIKYNGYYKNSDVMAFLYGFIAHYLLDSTVHPFVIAQCGYYDKTSKERRKATKKYRNLHDEAETLFDLMMIKEREKKSPSAFKLQDYCFDLTPFSQELNEVIDYTFQETFDAHHMHKYYYQSLKDMHKMMRYFRYDRTGIKKLGYSIVEGLTLRQTFHFSVISYHQSLKKLNDYRNLQHHTWIYPTKKSEASTASFDDLYQKAIKTITSVNQYFQDKKKVDLKKVFPNSSYVTGKNCNLKSHIH